MQRTDSAIPVVELTARNNAADSDNKIHDDAEARRYGYGGGLVPGVTLYAYLTRLAIAVHGPDWLVRGRADFTARRPVYAGERVRCDGAWAAPTTGNAEVNLRVTRDGAECAGGSFGLVDEVPAFAPLRANPAPLDELPELTPATVPIGIPLAPLYSPFSESDAVEYAAATDDPSTWYRGASPFGGPLTPPGWLAARQAPLLRASFQFGPSIHVRSVMQHLAPAFAGQTFVTHGTIRETFERKGNHYLLMDAETHDASGQSVCRVEHTTIFAVRAAQTAL